MENNKENWEWVDPKTLKLDGKNPNKITKSMKESLKENMLKFGWNMPIITDMNLIVADGEQKLIIALEENWNIVPILKKELSVSQRKLIRQSMNKIRGVHDAEMDAAEFKLILKSFEMEELTKLTGIDEQEILNTLEKTERDNAEEVSKVDKLYNIEIECPFCHKKWKKHKV